MHTPIDLVSATAGDLCLVHNGIIENRRLRDELQQLSCMFDSQTDSEVMPT